MKISSVSLCFVFVLAANGCSKTSVIGESSESGASEPQSAAPDPRDTAAAPAAEPTAMPGHRAPKVPSVISAGQSVTAFFNSPILGDVDGDGFDDFFVQGSVPERTEDVPPTTKVYLFYGRPVFSPQLTTADASAVFNAEGDVASALGDINGDGLSDFSLEGADGFAIVFGSPTRYSGEHASSSVGVVWTGKPLPLPDTLGFNTLSAIRPAGDVNGDGMADLIVTSISVSGADDSQMTVEPVDYLVLGHEEAWVSGEWDPSWAVAVFGSELVPDESGIGAPFRYPLAGYAAGDLDGDGFSDLLARSAESAFVFYGGPTQLEGELGPDRAAARLPLPSGGPLYAVGDLDADGRSDLAAGSGDTVGIVYGSTARFSGAQSVSYDFTITLDPTIGALITGAAGDIDSDGAPELLISGLHYARSPSDELTQNKFIYTVRGTGARLTGAHELSNAEGVLGPATDFGVVTPTSLAINYRDSRFSVLSLAGDVDGDGSCDILTQGAPSATGESRASVTLIPSTPRAPD
jgi:hypothetical protein